VKSDIKIELAREIALDVPSPSPDIGIRAGVDALHPTYRGRVVTSFAAWNFLELHGHRELTSVAVHSLQEYGVGLASGRDVGGITPAHLTCEARIGRFFAAEGALLFSTKNQAILSTITALCSEGVVVVGPSLTTLPLADASALMGAEYVEFESEDELRQILERYRLAKRIVVVAEAIASVTGQRLNTTRFLSALEQSGAWGMIDETAALGHSGLRGAGSAEDVPSSPALLARLMNFAPIAGVELAALVGSQELRDVLGNRSRYVRLEAAPSIIATAIVERALDLVEVAITQRDRLAMRSKMVSAALRAQGWNVVSDESAPITAIWCESLLKARELQDALLQRGVVVDALAARGLRRNGAVARILLSTGHSEEEITWLMDSLLEVRKRLPSAD
jgi:7-keto-8-aminopelargonate synthetase-like enzyme